MTSSRRFRTLNLSWLNFGSPKREITAERFESYFKKHAGGRFSIDSILGRHPAIGQL